MYNKSILITALLVLALAAGTVLRVNAHRAAFEELVSESLRTSAGYDQRFIDLVNRLEEELATRARFGYQGGKDPMTGKTRTVVVRRAPKKDAAPVEPDPVRLAALVQDDGRNSYTAVVMVGERSYAVNVSDRVEDYRVYNITADGVYLEKEGKLFFYDTYGRTRRQR